MVDFSHRAGDTGPGEEPTMCPDCGAPSNRYNGLCPSCLAKAAGGK